MTAWSAVSVLDDGWVDAAVDPVGAALRQAVLEVVHAGLRAGGTPPQGVRDVVLAAVGALADLSRLADREQVLLLAEARTRGASWDHCGAAAGVSRQALHRKYSDATAGVQQVAGAGPASTTGDLLAGMAKGVTTGPDRRPGAPRVVTA